MPNPEPKVMSQKRIFCNTCQNETNHTLLCEHPRDYVEEAENGQIMSVESLIERFWICAGCERATLEQCWTGDGMVDIKGNQIYESTYFPKRTMQDIRGKRFRQLPDGLDTIYRESLQAFNDNLPILCAAGLRTLLEGICVDKGIKRGTLEKKIDKLETLLPKNIVKSLHEFRFMGNQALHELNPPKIEDLRLAIEISEDILNFIYELEYKAKRLSHTQRSKPPTRSG